ncbi:MAG TPA: hypothetical protein VN922_19025 [Bacteroidia bacterium]|nr:hypothetical protein [Bacteroidia bacterium]
MERLTTEQAYEADRKFWSVCDYVSSLLIPGEKLNNWYVGMACQDTTDKCSVSENFTTHKKKYPEMDIATWKTFAIVNAEVSREVKRRLQEHGFDASEYKIDCEVDTIYIFRKKRNLIQQQLVEK